LLGKSERLFGIFEHLFVFGGHHSLPTLPKGKGGISLLAGRRLLAPKGASKSSSADAPWSSKGAPRFSSKGALALGSKGTWQPSKGPSAPGSRGRPLVGGGPLQAKGGKLGRAVIPTILKNTTFYLELQRVM